MHGHEEVPQGKEAESDARRFASAFLMPQPRMRATAPRWPSVADLIAFKKPWKVSLAGLNYRLHQLELVTDWHYRTLCIEIAKSGYRTSEPAPIQRETSQVLGKVFAALRKEGVGKADIAQALDLLPEELDDFVFHLAMLPVEPDARRPGAAAAQTVPTPSPHGKRLRVLQGGAE
jgi:hypothetical protein